MDVSSALLKQFKKIRYALVFFCFLALIQCRKPLKVTGVTINYSNGKAVSISLAGDAGTDSYTVFTQEGSDQPVLGSFNSQGTVTIFTPLVPFTEGQSYEVRDQNKTIIEFTVLKEQVDELPRLLAIYPSADTVPENLLKMYLVFSKPMQAVGSALDYIKVKNRTTDSYDAVFLALESELWNKDHTQLTLWLDPGRVKTDLIPNKEKGLPLKTGNHYRLILDKDFKDAQGNTLASAYTKDIYVGQRDLQKPNAEHWTVNSPSASSVEPLSIQFHEALDALLVLESITIMNKSNELIKGTFELGNNDRSVYFTPTNIWGKGTYTIKIDAELEDLAANNLNKLFDQDLKKPGSPKKDKEFFYKTFSIE